MARYVYGYKIVEDGDEILFSFPKFPEIITSLPIKHFVQKPSGELKEFLLDAVVVALQATVSLRQSIPKSDIPQLTDLDGFVSLPVHQTMTLELYKLYRANCSSVAEFARKLGKGETLARRLLDLRHRSLPSEIENAVALFGKELVHDWGLELSQSRCQPRPHGTRQQS